MQWAEYTVIAWLIGIAAICAALLGIYKFYKAMRPLFDSAIHTLNLKITKPVNERLDLVMEILERIESNQDTFKNEITFITVAQKEVMKRQKVTWWRANDKGETIEVPSQTCDLVDLHESQIMPMGWFARVRPEQKDRVKAAMEQSIETKQPFSEEFDIKCGDGKYRPFHGYSAHGNGDWFGILTAAASR